MKKIVYIVTGLAIVFMARLASADVVSLPRESQGLITFPATGGTYTLVSLVGPGKFVSAELVKQGGSNDLTFVGLEIDGNNVFNQSIAALKNTGLTQFNTYGVTLLQPSADMKTVTIGFPATLSFAKSLRLWVNVSESNVVQIQTKVLNGN